MRHSWLPGVLALGTAFTSQSWSDALALEPAGAPTELEVVVTARKIAEDAQDVPISVKVVSGEYLDDRGATRLYELQFAIPGLTVNTTGMFGAGFSLRGIADQRVAGLSVAPHLNGVYLGDANLAVARLFDVERIEVLKGPQGTLYGRNSTGGSINIITRAPQDRLDTGLEVARGSFDATRAQGHINLPFPSAAVRLAFSASDSDGYIRNSVDNRRFAEDDYWALRGSLRVATGDDWTLDVMAQHIRDDGGAGDLWTPRPDFLADPHDIRLTTVTLENPHLHSEIDNIDASLEYDLGPARLRSITGYARSDVRNVDDCAGIPVLAGCVRSALPNEFDQWSEELQLVFPRSGDVEGIVGAYYAEANTGANFYQLLPLINPEPLNDGHSTEHSTASALFGQGIMHFADRWSVTAGLRWSLEKRRETQIGTGIDDSHTLQVGTLESDDFSWLLALSRSINDDVMLYSSVSTGFKSGGFVTTAPGDSHAYGPENLTAYEIGGKSTWMAGRLMVNASAFFYDYDDLQVSTATILDDQIIFGVDNAAKAELYGVDAEMAFSASTHWSLDGGMVWLPKREFVDYRNEVTGDTLSGNKLVRAPEWSANAGINYEHPLRDYGSLSARLEYSYRSQYFYTPENDPQFSQDNFGLLNLRVRFEAASGSWYLFASGSNLLDEDYFHQVFLQSSPGYPDTYEFGIGLRF